MPANLSNSRIAIVAARTIFRAYESFNTRFTVITQRAKSRFENNDVQNMLRDSRQRLDLYKGVIDRVEAKVRDLLGPRIENEKVWASIKAVFSAYSSERQDWDIAETFFNSVTRRIFATQGVNEDIEFVATDFESPPNRSNELVYRRFENAMGLQDLVLRVLESTSFELPLVDANMFAATVAERIDQRMVLQDCGSTVAAEVIKSIFYRDGRAYLIGRIIGTSGCLPIVIVLQSREGGIYVEAVLLSEDDVSILFSFTRSYFNVLTSSPYQLVRFLRTILPAKRIAELYISIGFNKHGKTELYREIRDHLASTTKHFVLAPGDRGMVMRVFTMPGYDLVFKIIKDKFDPPKTTTRKIVREKYLHVFRHHRVGRLVDALQFEHLQFDRDRFDESLLQELCKVASENITVDKDSVYIHHLYVQRRVNPLNLLARSDSIDHNELEKIVLDFGMAIKDLARSNIFPGDLFLKNFGVTRHGRVVFYDYDELSEVTQCVFRKIPRASSYDEEIQAEPWFAVGEEDVFPEEFLQFLGLPPTVRDTFLDRHGDLFSVDFWQNAQARLNDGGWYDIQPFRSANLLA